MKSDRQKWNESFGNAEKCRRRVGDQIGSGKWNSFVQQAKENVSGAISGEQWRPASLSRHGASLPWTRNSRVDRRTRVMQGYPSRGGRASPHIAPCCTRTTTLRYLWYLRYNSIESDLTMRKFVVGSLLHLPLWSKRVEYKFWVGYNFCFKNPIVICYMHVYELCKLLERSVQKMSMNNG